MHEKVIVSNVNSVPVSGSTPVLDDVCRLVPQDVSELAVILEELHLGRGRRASVDGGAQNPNLGQ